MNVFGIFTRVVVAWVKTDPDDKRFVNLVLHFTNHKVDDGC